MTDLPDPLVPADCDCTDLDGFMLNVERLMASELVALSSHEVVAAALFLWCRAWKQRPAASLPDDERVLAAFSRLPLPRFRKLRDEVLRGFVKCSDGRFYHPVLSSEARKAFERKEAFRKKRETDADRLRRWRESQGETAPETVAETRFETRFVAEGQGQGQGQVVKKESKPNGLERASAPPKRGCRLPEGWGPGPDLVAWTINGDPENNWPGLDSGRMIVERDKFRDHWRQQPGQKGVKLDWDAAWRNWCRRAAQDAVNRPHNHTKSAGSFL